MEIFLDGFATVARLAGDLSIAGHGSVMTPAQLIVTAHVVSVMMIVALMERVRTLVVAVVVLARFAGLIAQVPVALFIRMPSVLTMHVAGVKTLVLAQGETLLVTHIVGASLAVAMLTIFVSTTSIIASHAAQPVGPALIRKMAELAIVLLLKLVAHLALCVGSNFVKLMVQNEIFVHARVVDQPKVLRECLEHLLAKFTTRADVLHPVALVEGHVKPFHRKTRGGLLEVALG